MSHTFEELRVYRKEENSALVCHNNLSFYVEFNEILFET